MTRPKADLLQGTFDLLILKALSLGPLDGYGMIQRIRHLSDELLEVEESSLYPAVYRIEQRGWINFNQLTAGEEKCDRLALAMAQVRKATSGG